MKNKLSLLLVLMAIYATSQTKRFIYDIQYKKDSTSEVLTKENYILDINKDEILYYVRDFFIADSLISNNIPFPKDLKLNTSTIISHKKGSNDFDEYDLIESTVLKLQTKDSQNWKLTDEKKVIKDLKLQKATCNSGGRNWIAWFTTDFPFQNGPYKFHGLPGLIIELHDDKNNYNFELVKSENISETSENQFIATSKQISVPITWEKYKDTKLKYYASPVNFLKNGQPSDQFYLNDGTIVNPKNYKEINERLKNNLKKYNNPIDLERAVVYP